MCVCMRERGESIYVCMCVCGVKMIGTVDWYFSKIY